MSDAFSAMAIVGAFKFPEATDGMIDESTTRRFCVPNTRHFESTTARGSLSWPILAEHDGW